MSNAEISRPKRSPLALTVMVVAAVFAVVTFLSGFWTDWQWYSSVDHSSVFTKQLVLRGGLFAIVGGITALVVWLSATMAHRVRPLDGWMSPESMALLRYREGLDSVRRVIFLTGSLIFGALVGISAASQWQIVMLWRNASAFGTKDPQFGKDISFYMFDLPFYRFVIGFAFTILIAALIANIFVHFIYGGFRSGGIKLSSNGARAHLMFFLGIISLLKAAAYSIDKFSLATKSDSLMTGLRYTDVHALVPAKTILTYIALATAILFFVSLVRPGWSLPFIAFGVMLGASFLLGGLYPSFVQQVQVKPSELQRETPYIQRNLDATRAAYGLTNVKLTEYQAIDDPSLASTSKDSGTLTNIRLLDPSLVSPTFRNLQQIRGFYAFPDSLDIDRYALNNVKRGSVVALREVNLAGVADSQRNWFNDHMVFTHGYGAVAAYENTASADGAPSFFESDVPPSGLLNIKQPRVYFGEQSPTYSIVGSPSGAAPRELDYPDDKSANGQTNNTYDGKGGVPIGNFFQRLLFAVHYQEPNIVLSNQLSSSSKILYDRDPATRVKKIAPWLTLDSDPYPAVVDGKIQWIIDGYTTSNEYPYAARLSLGDVTADSVNTQSTGQLASGEVTYVRNSVKATVDAYDGTIHIYAWDQNDPVLKAWSKVFPGVVENASAMPAGILQHVRYPEDLFKIQRNVLAKYHVPDAQSFYSGQDFWNIPDDPTKPKVKQAQPPYFLTLRMPDQKAPSFQLTTAFAPNKRQTLAAFMSVNSDPGPDYGTIRVLQLPRNTTIPGPTQVQNNFESDPDVSKQLSLLRSGGSDVELGNLLSLPVGGGLLYFEPVYVRASGADGYPLLRKVLVSFGSKVAFEDDLKTALVKVFSDQNAGGPSPTTPTGSTPQAELAAALLDANKAYADGQAALAKGDFAAYGLAQKRLEAALTRATQAGGKIAGAGTATPSPSPSATP